MNTCSACGQENPAIARFCLACGEPFADSASTAHEERRVVSVIFVERVDLVLAEPRGVIAEMVAAAAPERLAG